MSKHEKKTSKMSKKDNKLVTVPSVIMVWQFKLQDAMFFFVCKCNANAKNVQFGHLWKRLDANCQYYLPFRLSYMPLHFMAWKVFEWYIQYVTYCNIYCTSMMKMAKTPTEGQVICRPISIIHKQGILFNKVYLTRLIL